LKTAVGLLTEAKRPLLIFPEGMVSRSNDYLRPFMDGVALIARGAARQRAAAGGRVVVHPVAVRYWFVGDLDAALAPALEEMETHCGWTPRRESP
jgi:1-acyl-sn-glycerol-3-phosphate acyltransferase